MIDIYFIILFMILEDFHDRLTTPKRESLVMGLVSS